MQDYWQGYVDISLPKGITSIQASVFVVVIAICVGNCILLVPKTKRKKSCFLVEKIKGNS